MVGEYLEGGGGADKNKQMAVAGPAEEYEDTEEDWEYAGLEAIDEACLSLYPDQLNPLQTSAVVKFW